MLAMTIYGECETRGFRLPVTISDLAETGCALESDAAGKLPDGEMALWIGAIGPLAVIAMHKDQSRSIASFKQPLDERIIDHFR
jgi:hypothetical protein